MLRLPPKLLVLVRHAESTRNVAKGDAVFYPDDASRATVGLVADHQIPITDAGRLQAEALGRRLRADGPPDVVFHSGYVRTQQTTAGLLSAWPESERRSIPVREHAFVRERDAGYGFQMTSAEAAAAFPWLQAYWQEAGPLFARPPGGESLADVALRVHAFLELLDKECADQRVLVVTHTGTLRVFRYLLEGWTREEFDAHWTSVKFPNCGVVKYAPGAGGRWSRVAGE
jgi:probable phosphoglycerate mutase